MRYRPTVEYVGKRITEDRDRLMKKPTEPHKTSSMEKMVGKKIYVYLNDLSGLITGTLKQVNSYDLVIDNPSLEFVAELSSNGKQCALDRIILSKHSVMMIAEQKEESEGVRDNSQNT